MSQGPPAAERMISPWRALRAGLARALSPVRDFLFPPQCLLCGAPLVDLLPALCGPCRSGLLPASRDRCERCAAPIGPHLTTSAGCVHCRDERFAFRRVLALGVYEGNLRSAILRGKEPTGAALVTALTDLLIDTCLGDLLTEPFDAVVPVPHDWRRRFWRLHSPAETIAHRLAQRLQRRYAPHLLRKPRSTPLQSRTPPALRRRQQRQAFEVPAVWNLAGARLLLVDDVLTTGATAHAAATALRDRQAADVLVVVLARGIGQPRGVS